MPDGSWPPGRGAPEPLERVRRFVNTANPESGADHFETPASLAAWLEREGYGRPRVTERDRTRSSGSGAPRPGGQLPSGTKRPRWSVGRSAARLPPLAWVCWFVGLMCYHRTYYTGITGLNARRREGSAPARGDRACERLPNSGTEPGR